MKFHEKLVKLRKSKGYTQEELAEKPGVSRQAVARWEAGDTTPDMKMLLGICGKAQNPEKSEGSDWSVALMDMGASVIARLKNKAKETGKPFQLHLQLFCQEEFLRRLASSRYAENLVLKGGLFIYMLTNFESRATVF